MEGGFQSEVIRDKVKGESPSFLMYIITLLLPPFSSSPHSMDVWGVVQAKFE